MSSSASPTQSLGKTLLDLGRVSNLPTVWTNCLAGWLIGGGGRVDRFILLGFAASLIYVAGMYLNDAFDADWDAAHKNDRPIPRGLIGRRTVWLSGWAMLFAGLGGIATLGIQTAILAGIMVFWVVLYDTLHKGISWSPLPMAACRLFLFLTAVSCGQVGITGYAVWCSVALAAYIIGLSYLAKAESLPGMLRYWPLFLLAVPLVLAIIVNDGEAMDEGLFAALILLLWLLKCLRHLFWSGRPSIGRAVGGLLAGICLVDLLAVAVVPRELLFLFVVGFVLCLGLQRSIAAT
jgi:hypothetical protein